MSDAAKTRRTGAKAGADIPQVVVESRAAWRAWLKANHSKRESIWLVTYKKAAAPERYLSYDDIVDEALCFGWIDSLPRTLDAERSMRLLARRKPGSSWSAVNKARVERLVAAGQMTSAGLSVIEAAKRDGSWDRLSEVEALTVPPDLKRALAQHAPAANFASFPRSSKRNILEWIQSAKRPETREQRIRTTAEMAAKNLRANHWRQPGDAK